MEAALDKPYCVASLPYTEDKDSKAVRHNNNYSLPSECKPLCFGSSRDHTIYGHYHTIYGHYHEGYMTIPYMVLPYKVNW